MTYFDVIFVLIGICFLLDIVIAANVVSYEAHFEDVKIINDVMQTDFYSIRQIRVRKVNQTTFAFDMDINMLVDFDDSFSVCIYLIKHSETITMSFIFILNRLKSDIFIADMVSSP